MAAHLENYITGDGRLLQAEDICAVHRDVVSLSIPYAGKIQHIAKNNYSLKCHFDATDCDKLESVATTKAYSLKTTTRNNGAETYIDSVICVTDPQTVSEIAVATSNNGRFLARLKLGTSKQQLLEIWERSKLLKTIDTSATHGQVCTDRVFGSFRWSPFGEQDKLLYICRANKQHSAGSNNAYEKRESWGEGLAGVEHTKLVILDVGQNFEFSVLDIEGSSLADSRWLEGMKTVSVAYSETPPRHALMTAKNAASKLLVHDWSDGPARQVCEIDDVERCFTKPRVDNSGRRFLYCVASTLGLENQPLELHLYDMDTLQSRKLQDSESKEDEHFMFGLADNCFTSDDQHVLFMKHDHLFHHMCLFSLQSSTIKRIKFPTTAIQLLDFRHNLILAAGSEVNVTPTVFVAYLNPSDAGELVTWHQIEECVHLDEIDYEPYRIPTSAGSHSISGLLITPNISALRQNSIQTRSVEKTSGEKLINSQLELPTVVAIHGGPQSTWIANYMESFVVFARMGLRSLLVNYRGSSGVDRAYTESLCGNVGKVDVDDCLEAIRHFVKNKLINANKLVLYGGSYGGFLSCHLSCQQEFKFTSAIVWNPLVDCSLLREPRFCRFVVGKHEPDSSHLLNTQDLAKMFECSPVSRSHLAQVPTLILLGNHDSCVPNAHGELWFELLGQKGVETQCKVYEDGHALGRAESRIDSTITAVKWILRNLQTST